MSAANAHHPWRAGFSPKARALPRGVMSLALLDRELEKAEMFEELERRSFRALEDVHGARDPSFKHVGEGTARRVPVRYE